VEAPLGTGRTAARRRSPVSDVASTVGLPRLSRISRAMITPMSGRGGDQEQDCHQKSAHYDEK
jgi:hypothetical protein